MCAASDAAEGRIARAGYIMAMTRTHAAGLDKAKKFRDKSIKFEIAQRMAGRNRPAERGPIVER